MNAFSCFKILKFSGGACPKKKTPRKGVLMGPLLIQLSTASVLTSWLLETPDLR